MNTKKLEEKNVGIVNFSIDKLIADPANPRQVFDPQTMAMLEHSIRTFGILSPLIVEKRKDGKCLIVDGERRFRVALLVGLKEIPVRIYEPMTDLERLAKRFNLQEQHEQWSIFDKAIAVQNFQKATQKSIKEIADTLGVAPKTISNYLLVSVLSHRTTTFASEKKLPFEWLVEVSRIIKSINEGNFRNELENAILLKANNRIVLSSKELRKYLIAINKGGKKIIEKIIKDEKYTPQQALEDSNSTYDMILKIMHSQVVGINTNLNRMIKALKEDNVLIPSALKYSLHETHGLIEVLEKLGK